MSMSTRVLLWSEFGWEYADIQKIKDNFFETKEIEYDLLYFTAWNITDKDFIKNKIKELNVNYDAIIFRGEGTGCLEFEERGK